MFEFGRGDFMRGFGGRHGGRGRHGFGRHAHGEDGMGRILGHGDLRYLILSLLEEKPRHGYELIKALEELSFGVYTPSPGAIYPTLTYLEEGGFATAALVENKKQYTITAEGRALLDDKRDDLKMMLARFSKFSEKVTKLRQWMGREDAEEVGREKSSSIRRSIHQLRAELFSFMEAKAETKQKIADIIDQATAEIKKLRE